jgi:hypothetical protein
MKLHFLTSRPILQITDFDIEKKKLIEDFAIIDKRGVQWFVPAGYITDGASIPSDLEFLIGDPFEGVTTAGSLVHDYYCDTKERSQKDTHRIFREIVEFDMKRNSSYGWFKLPWKNKLWQYTRVKLMWISIRIYNKMKKPSWK